MPNSAAIRSRVATWTASLPRSVISASRPRPSAGLGLRITMPERLQAVDRVGHRGRVHHQPLPHHPQRQRALPAERQQHEGLVPGEGSPYGRRIASSSAEQDLLRAHDRGDRRHRRRRSEPALPDPRRAIDRVEGQAKLSGHTDTLCSNCAWGTAPRTARWRGTARPVAGSASVSGAGPRGRRDVPPLRQWRREGNATPSFG